MSPRLTVSTLFQKVNKKINKPTKIVKEQLYLTEETAESRTNVSKMRNRTKTNNQDSWKQPTCTILRSIKGSSLPSPPTKADGSRVKRTKQ